MTDIRCYETLNPDSDVDVVEFDVLEFDVVEFDVVEFDDVPQQNDEKKLFPAYWDDAPPNLLELWTDE